MKIEKYNFQILSNKNNGEKKNNINRVLTSILQNIKMKQESLYQTQKCLIFKIINNYILLDFNLNKIIPFLYSY